MTVFKNTALKVKAFAMFNLKSALLSFTVLSLSSCATDPKVLEQESKEAQALSATDFTKNLEHKMFFYNLEMLTDTDDSHVHIYRTRGIYDVSYNYLGSKYRRFCNLKGGELHYQFCVDEKVNKPIFFVSFTNHRAKTDVLEERGMTVDEEKFNELLANQKATARAARKDAGADAWKNTSVKIDAEKTVFTGYTDFTAEAKVLALVNADGELVDMLGAGEKGSVVLDKTPFYATSGGQVADTGVITADGVEFDVEDTSKNADGIYIHSGMVKEGVVSVGNTVNAQIDADRRKSVMRNHTAAHLLQAALREVLGTHVEQAGQLVNDKEVRFDFTHFNPLTTEELSRVEAIVNKEILACVPVSMQEMPIEEAKKMGAMMLFGEKYGDIVRVVKAGDASTEFCGGTHVASTGELGLFKIVSEASVAAGVRRIVALTGTGVLNYLNECEDTVKFASATFKSADNEVKDRITAIVAENKAKDKEIQNLNAEMTKLKSADMFSSAVDVDGIELYTAKVEGTTPDALRSMGDDVKTKGDNVVAVLAGVNGDKANFVAVCGKGAIAKGVKAGDLVKEVAKIANGGGGGRPDSAMAGAKDITKIDEALSKAEEIVKSLIK